MVFARTVWAFHSKKCSAFIQMALAILLKKTIIRRSNGSRYLFKKNVKPPLSLPGGVFISSPFEQGGGGLFKWEMMMVKKENTKWKILITRSWSSCSRGSESNPNFQVVNKPSRISPHKVLESWLINTVNHLLLKSN